MKWNICYRGFMVHDGAVFEEWGSAVSHARSGVAGENADIFFFFFFFLFLWSGKKCIK